MSQTITILGTRPASAAFAVFPLTAAAAQPPTSVQEPTNDVQVFSGTNSPCQFGITFTGTGEVTITAFYDTNGTPIRQSVHDSLMHTIFSAWHTFASNGPAPVQLDLSTGQMVVTGKEYTFHVSDDGIVYGQDGRLILATDGSELSFVGNSAVNASELCAALGP